MQKTQFQQPRPEQEKNMKKKRDYSFLDNPFKQNGENSARCLSEDEYILSERLDFKQFLFLVTLCFWADSFKERRWTRHMLRNISELKTVDVHTKAT